MPDFSTKTIIVTGGGRGIGHGISAAFARAGADVIICSRSEPLAFDPAIASRIHHIELDIRQAEAAEALIDFAVERTGRLDCLINNAGGGPPVKSEEASPRLTEAVIKLNLLAPIYLSQAAYVKMRALNIKGNIINISSVSATRSSPGTVAYGAAKAGLLNVTTSLAMEWAPDIRVNAIIVGLVETEASADHYGGQKGMDFLAANLPMGRMGKPQDIAHACLFLADEQSSYVSGACLEVFGGGEPPSFLKITAEAAAQGRDND
jgi:NAD(P)-dependent dehydrogenase (short-subunit alcohol dehydrogenase family)